ESGELAHRLDDGGKTEKIPRADPQHLATLVAAQERGDLCDRRSIVSLSESGDVLVGRYGTDAESAFEPVGVDARNRHQHHGEHSARATNSQQRLDQSRSGIPA